MKKLVRFGDIHFSALNTWNIDAGERFLKWFEKEDFGDKQDLELCLAGDISEKDTNPGIVIDQMIRFFNLCKQKFSKTYVCLGNHDRKLYHGEEQHNCMFLRNDQDICIIEQETSLVTPNGFEVLFLPHKKVENFVSLSKYYTDKAQELMSLSKNGIYDTIVGHFQIKSNTGKFSFLEGVDISKYKTHSWSIGHIHIRIDEKYLGSVWPNNVDEQNTKLPRGYKVLDENKVDTHVCIPTDFLEYKTIKFGQDLESDGNVVYTIEDAPSVKEAEEKYNSFNVRQISHMSQVSVDTDAEIEKSSLLDVQRDYKKLFDDMIRELNIDVSRSIYAYIQTLF